jgi:hypothetical protein
MSTNNGVKGANSRVCHKQCQVVVVIQGACHFLMSMNVYKHSNLVYKLFIVITIEHLTICSY